MRYVLPLQPPIQHPPIATRIKWKFKLTAERVSYGWVLRFSALYHTHDMDLRQNPIIGVDSTSWMGATAPDRPSFASGGASSLPLYMASVAAASKSPHACIT